MFAKLSQLIAKPGDHRPDGTLPATKLAPKVAAAGSMAMVTSVVVWGLRMLGVKVGEDEIDNVFAAGVTIFNFGVFLVSYLARDTTAVKTK